MSCGGCAKRGQILKQAGAALQRGQYAKAGQRIGTVAVSAAKAAKSAITVRRPK